MDRNSIWKWLVLITLVCGSMAVVWPIQEKVQLGIDLKGGTSIVLEVDTSELDEQGKVDAQDRALEVIRNRVDGLGVSEPIIYPVPGTYRIVVQLPGLKAEDQKEAIDLIQRAAFLEFRIVHEDNTALVNELFEKKLAPPGYRIVMINEQGFDGTFRENPYYKRDTSLDPEGATPEEMKAKLMKFQAQRGHVLMLTKEIRQDQEFFQPAYVSRRRELTGESLKNANVDFEQLGQAMVSLEFNSDGATRFARVTEDYSPGGAKNPSKEERRQLAIILDNTLYSAPYLNEPIYGGRAQITGSFSLQEAKRLAIALQAGSLPAPVEVAEMRLVDPTLGKDSITSGARAAIDGFACVLVFMLCYYLLAGVVANIALLLDIILLPLGMIIAAGFLSMFTGETSSGGAIGLPTLTLPGIAGIVLTIGMAVDANVLIFERIREEQRSGKGYKASIQAGYEKAFSTIMDANVTTLLTAAILFWKGSGPIKGFAVTLSAGIIVSMYVALVVTRMLFNTIGQRTKIQKVRMLSIVGDWNINFVGMRYIAAVLSVALIVGTWSMFVKRGDENFGVDFTGGASITYSFDEKVDAEEVRDTLTANGVAESFIQYQKELAADETGKVKEYLEVKVGFDEGELVSSTLTNSFAAQGYSIVKEDSVGPQVSHELMWSGIWAIVTALIGIVIYISIRFEFAFAMGAIAALAHDVLITIGIYCLLGRQLSLPIVAALLTIVGYSVNDTIVVFDRIREDLKLIRDKSYKEIANISINQTLSRTLLTSITTLITVVMLLVFGGGAINDFALALFIGILVGTYSSVFVATPVMLLWHKEKKA